MTNTPPVQPMTRRERRLLEEQGVVPAVAPPVSEANVAPEVALPPAPPVVASVSRRELRAAERGVETQAFEVSPEPPVPQVSEPLPAVSVPQEPLPPVFGSVPVAPPVSAQTPTPRVDPFPTPSQSPSRLVGDVPSVTSSLILPTTPTVDMTSPLSSTGEVVVTGQITLPSHVSERGTAPLLSHSADQDEVMDAYVTGEMAAMSKPVRASQAVSGKGDDSDIFLVRRARWGVAAVVTALVAAVLGVAAVGLVLLALFTDVLG